MVLPTSRLETDWVVLPVTAGRAEGRGVFDCACVCVGVPIYMIEGFALRQSSIPSIEGNKTRTGVNGDVGGNS